MNEQELQLAFIQFLAQKTGAKTQQELEAVIQQLGEEGLKQAYAEFMQVMLQQLVLAAKFGAKLNYIKQLRGKCPEGYEVSYYKKGGQLCKKCMKKQVMLEGSKIPLDPIDAFKCGRKMKNRKNNSIDKNLKGKKFPQITSARNADGSKYKFGTDDASSDAIYNNIYGYYHNNNELTDASRDFMKNARIGNEVAGDYYDKLYGVYMNPEELGKVKLSIRFEAPPITLESGFEQNTEEENNAQTDIDNIKALITLEEQTNYRLPERRKVTRRDVRDYFRSKGINPYSVSAAQRRAIRNNWNNGVDYR